MPPSNDDLANAITISGASGNTSPVTIDDATVEVGEPVGANLLNPPEHQSIWYSWVAPITKSFVFDTFGSLAGDENSGDGDPEVPPFGSLDTTLSIWTGTNFGDFVEVDSNEDNDDPGTGYWSQVSFSATIGTTYWIQIGTYADPFTGTVILNWNPLFPKHKVDALIHDTKIFHYVDVKLAQHSGTILGLLPGYTDGIPIDVNSSGIACGTVAIGNSSRRAVAWDTSTGQVTALPLITDGLDSQAAAIADDGTIVGICGRGSPFNDQRPVKWPNTSTVVELANLSPNTVYYITDISSSGAIIGYASNGLFGSAQSIIWNPTPTAFTGVAFIYSINSNNDVVGVQIGGSPVNSAVMYPNGTTSSPTILDNPFPDGTTYRPYGISTDRSIVGWTQVEHDIFTLYNYAIYLPQAGSLITLPDPINEVGGGGTEQPFAIGTAISPSGNYIVGGAGSLSHDERPVIWPSSTSDPIYLEPNLTNNQTGEALGVNDNGLIVGYIFPESNNIPMVWQYTAPESDPDALPATGTALFASFENINWY